MKTLSLPHRLFHSDPTPDFSHLKYSTINYEWEHLYNPQVNLNSPTFATAQNHRNKNRYPDILPYEKNRVVLSKSQYINASKVSIQSKNFISCQAPLPQTFNDFWTMVWEHKTPVIVMLTKLIEGKKIKAHCYWPSNIGHAETFGDITVVLDSVDSDDKMVKRIFSVSRIDDPSETLKVLHIHYVDWPDFGVPENPHSIIKVIEEIDSFVEVSHASSTAPVVVHCSAGIGRTGTLLAIIAFIEHKKMSHLESIQDIVNSLRKQRIGMVQTFEQYRFIYNVVEQLNAM